VFYYFGRKGLLAPSYPAPLFDLVIEPFAGSMAYTMHYRPKMAIGIEADLRVALLWDRLVHASLGEIRTMRVPPIGARTTDLYWMLPSSSNSTLTSKSRTMTWFAYERALAQQAMTIRNHPYARNHVLYHHGDYREAPDVEATWFIDPPYSGVNGGYGAGHSAVDYEELAEWCLVRKGQPIVCEGPYARWLAFRKHGRPRGTRTAMGVERTNTEVVWTGPIAVCAAPRCETRFQPSSARHRYCSGRCRVAAHRARLATPGTIS
jgi:hypothetical protein